MSAPRNVDDAFRAVMRPTNAKRGPLPISQRVVDFVESCDTVIDLIFDAPSSARLLPGVEVEQPAAMLKAYLLFLASEAPNDEEQGRVASWHKRLGPEVWKLLGFSQAPTLLTLEPAFELMRDRDHQAPELRALTLSVAFFAGASLFVELSR